MYLKNKFCVLVLVALLARVFAQDTPQDNPYRVRDIIHSFGQAVKGAVSIIIFTQLMQKEVGRLVIFFARTSLVKTFSERIFSLCSFCTDQEGTGLDSNGSPLGTLHIMAGGIERVRLSFR